MAKPGGTGAVGPFPPRVGDGDEEHDEYDRLRRRVLWAMPSGLFVVGSTDGADRRNLMTANWVMVTNCR
jgi:flavin reductase (DIM6/NTAB) family NADH-FMN oxidoreductase RutF